MADTHIVYDTYIRLIASGESADDAQELVTEAFPNHDPALVAAILDNEGDAERAERQMLRNELAARRGAVTYELSDEVITGRPPQNEAANAAFRKRARAALGRS